PRPDLVSGWAATHPPTRVDLVGPAQQRRGGHALPAGGLTAEPRQEVEQVRSRLHRVAHEIVRAIPVELVPMLGLAERPQYRGGPVFTSAMAFSKPDSDRSIISSDAVSEMRNVPGNSATLP